MTIRRILVGVASVALAACVPDTAVSTSADTATSGSICPTWRCDTNAATIGDGIVFDELDLARGYNGGGVRIHAVWRGTRSLWLGVNRDRLFAYDRSDPTQQLWGHDL